MPLPRMTTRRWMLAAAVVAVFVYGIQLWQIRGARRMRAGFHLGRSIAYREQGAWLRTLVAEGKVRSVSPNEAIVWSNHHARLWHKYERASRRPWLPVPPDPPPPE